MSLDSILEHIISNADIEAGKIIEEARLSKENILKEAKEEADKLYNQRLQKEKAAGERIREGLLVNARLESKKSILAAKQGLLSEVFEKLKPAFAGAKLSRELIGRDKTSEVAEDIDFYIDKIRRDYEAEVAKILFE